MDCLNSLEYYRFSDSFLEGEKGSYNVFVKIFPPPADGEIITVPYTISGTATNSIDYHIYRTINLTFSSSSIQAAISYTDVKDNIREPDETIIFTLGTPSGGSVTVDPDRDVYTRTIVNDDKYRVYWEFTVSASGEDDQEHSAIAKIEPTPSGADVITVDYMISGTATHGASMDYQFNPESSPKPLVFSSSAQHLILFTVKTDAVIGENPPETIVLTMQSPDNPGIAALDEVRKVFTHTIQDCQCRVVTFASSGYSIPENHQYGFDVTMSLEPGPNNTITIPFSFGGIATENSDYTKISPPTMYLEFTNFQIKRQILIQVNPDNEIEGDEYFDIVLEPGAGYTFGQYPSIRMTIIDRVDVIYVKPDGNDANNGTTWDNALATIQAAIDLAQYGNQIWVAEGTYTSRHTNGFDENCVAEFTFKDNIKLYGGFTVGDENLSDRDFNINKSVFNAQGHYSTLNIIDCNDILVDGIELRNTAYEGIYPSGLFKEGAGNRVENCTFTEIGSSFQIENTTNTSSNFTFEYCKAEGNERVYGPLFNIAGTCIISKCFFTNNHNDLGFSLGGALHITGGNQFISNCIFTGNSSDGGGGAISIYFDLFKPASPFVANCKFINNSTQTGGGAISMFVPRGNNQMDMQFHAINCTFIGNTCSGNGGAIDCGYFNGNINIFNSIFWSNNALDGKHISSYNSIGDNPVILKNCFIDATSPYIKGYFDKSNLEFNEGGPGLDSQHRPELNSSCINKGDSVLLPDDIADLDSDGNTTEDIPYDLDHELQHSRSVGQNVDIGAYERQ